MVAAFLWDVGEEADPDGAVAPSRPVWSRVADFLWDVDEEANGNITPSPARGASTEPLAALPPDDVVASLQGQVIAFPMSVYARPRSMPCQ